MIDFVLWLIQDEGGRGRTRAKPQPFRFEPVKVRVVFPYGNLHPFPLDSHNLPRSVGYADGNSKTKFSRSRSDLPLYGQTASLTLQQTAGQGMRGVCNTPSNSPVVLWKQCGGVGGAGSKQKSRGFPCLFSFNRFVAVTIGM